MCTCSLVVWIPMIIIIDEIYVGFVLSEQAFIGTNFPLFLLQIQTIEASCSNQDAFTSNSRYSRQTLKIILPLKTLEFATVRKSLPRLVAYCRWTVEAHAFDKISDVVDQMITYWASLAYEHGRKAHRSKRIRSQLYSYRHQVTSLLYMEHTDRWGQRVSRVDTSNITQVYHIYSLLLYTSLKRFTSW